MLSFVDTLKLTGYKPCGLVVKTRLSWHVGIFVLVPVKLMGSHCDCMTCEFVMSGKGGF